MKTSARVILGIVRENLGTPEGRSISEWSKELAQANRDKTLAIVTMAEQVVGLGDDIKHAREQLGYMRIRKDYFLGKCKDLRDQVFKLEQFTGTQLTSEDEDTLEAYAELSRWWDQVAEAVFPDEDTEDICDELLLSQIRTLAYANRAIAACLECDKDRTIHSVRVAKDKLRWYEAVNRG